MQNPQAEFKSPVLRPNQAAKYLGITRRFLDTLHEQDPTFPRKIYLSPKAVCFRKDSLDKWLKKKEATGV